MEGVPNGKELSSDDVLRWLYAHPWAVDAMSRAVNHEYRLNTVWRWFDVRLPKHTLDRMVIDGVVNKEQGGYRTVDYEAVNDALKRYYAEQQEAERQAKEYASGHMIEMPTPAGVPHDIFDDLLGYETLKKELMMALRGKVHTLLVGAPSTGKSLAMECVLKLPGSKLVFAGKGQMTAAGIRKILTDEKPSVLCIDELEKSDPNDIAILNEVLERGTVTVTQFTQTRQTDLSIQVFAAGNRIERLPEEIVSKFHVIRFPPFSQEDFIRVAKAYLLRQGKNEEVVDAIAIGLSRKTRNIRDAIRIAKMATTADDAYFLIGRLGEDAKV